MSSVVKAILSFFVNKGRDKAAEKLKEGDVTELKLRELIVREIDDIKSKLDGLARRDLLSAIDFFEEGLVLLSKVVVRSRKFQGTIANSIENTASLTETVTNLELVGLDELEREAFSASKERFKDARRKATEAFNDEALSIIDRVQAMEYRVMATILETVENPSAGLPSIRLCIERLHALSAVQNSFKVELTKGPRALFTKDERRKIISSVCHLNRLVYDFNQLSDQAVNLWNWPCIYFGGETLDPLRDSRVLKTLSDLGMDYCCVMPWAFGQDGEQAHRLSKSARGIVETVQGEFIIGDNEDRNRNVKVFDGNGTFLKSFSLSTDDLSTTLSLYDVAADDDDNVYVLVRQMKAGYDDRVHMGVYVYDSSGSQHHTFPLTDRPRDWFWYALTVNESRKVMLVARKAIDVYETDGQFLRSFGQGILRDARAIAAGNGGRAMVVDTPCVHAFSEKGEHLFEMEVQGSYSPHVIAFHRQSDHIVVVGQAQGNGDVRVLIYTKEGDFVRSIQLGIDSLPQAISATKGGRFAVVYRDVNFQSVVLVV